MPAPHDKRRVTRLHYEKQLRDAKRMRGGSPCPCMLLTVLALQLVAVGGVPVWQVLT